MPEIPEIGVRSVSVPEMPSYRPLDFTPGAMTYESAKPPAVDVPEEKEPTDSHPKSQSAKPTPPAEQLADFLTIAPEIPCPPPDAIPIGAKNKSQTAIVVGYRRIDGKCETQYEMLDVPTIVGNYLPGAPVVMTTATVAAMATTAAIFAKPLGDFLLKAVKPTVKKTIKKINAMRGKKAQIESVFQR
ncbi:MAG: hypothetical protein EBV86_17395, partial [Marivivens sp.]|nr:hypothetical protein [Marivivens sp.]